MIQRKVVKTENLTSYGLACAVNDAFECHYSLRGVELFTMAGRPYVDFYFEREIDEMGLPIVQEGYTTKKEVHNETE